MQYRRCRPADRCLAACLAILPVLADVAAHAAGRPKPPLIAITNSWFETSAKTQVAGFFTITNNGDKPVLIDGWKSPACGNLAFHEATVQSSTARSASIDRVTVPPNATMAFARGGYHLVCDNPDASVQVGRTVPVTISFLSGRTVTATFAVRDPGKP